jgi:GGDEF domain-containing protein
VIEHPIAWSAGPDAALRVSASVGIALHSPGLGADDLLRHADHAMHAAKSRGPGEIGVDDGSTRSSDVVAAA